MDVSKFLAGLDLSLLITSIIGGLLWGRLYNRRLNLSVGLIYHKFLTGAGYLLIILLSRFATGGSIGPWERWVGFIIVWGVFCLFIRIGMGKVSPSSHINLSVEVESLRHERDQKDKQISDLIKELDSRGGDPTGG